MLGFPYEAVQTTQYSHSDNTIPLIVDPWDVVGALAKHIPELRSGALQPVASNEMPGHCLQPRWTDATSERR
jgi:hypothetical protein